MRPVTPLVSCLLLAPTSTARAQPTLHPPPGAAPVASPTPSPRAAPPANAKDTSTVCQAPTFTFRWGDNRGANVDIIATASPKARFDLVIWDKDESKGCNILDEEPVLDDGANKGEPEGNENKGATHKLCKDEEATANKSANDGEAEGHNKEAQRKLCCVVQQVQDYGEHGVQNVVQLTNVMADGNPVPVALERFHLLKAGGRVCVAFIGRSDGADTICRERRLGTAAVQALEKHHLGIDIGISYSLNADGSWTNKAEIAVNATSRWSSWLYGVIDVRDAWLGAVQGTTSQQSTGQQGSAQQTSGQQAASQQTSGSSQSNPFVSGGSTFQATARALVGPWGKEWNTSSAAFVLGAGVRTVPTAGSSQQSASATSMGSTSSPLFVSPALPSVDVRPELFCGVRLEVLGYNAGQPAESLGGTRGYFEVGYARDRFWLVQPGPGVTQAFKQENRWYAEGQLEIPAVGGQYLRLLVRARVDLPTSLSGPSEVRISALATIDPHVIGCIFGGKCSSTSPTGTAKTGSATD